MGWSYGGLSGGDGPDPDQLRAWQRRMTAPDNEVPAAVPVSLVLARSADLAVAVTGVHVYSTGLSFHLAVRLRQQGSAEDSRRLHRSLLGFPGDDVEEQLLLGVEYSDGRTATNLGGLDVSTWDSPADEPVLVPGGGGGGGGTYDQRMWLSPLPGPGPFAFVCAWPARSLPECRTEVDGGLFATAAPDVVVLWPPEPVPPAPPERPSANLPETGWFGRAARRDG